MIVSKQHYNFEIDEGSDFVKRFYYYEDSTGLPIDLTDYSATMQVRTEYEGIYNSTDPVLSYTSGVSGAIILGGGNGTIDVVIPATDTQNKVWDKASYDLFITDDDGKRSKFLKGFFTIIQSDTLVP